MCRTSDDGPNGITCLLTEASTPGLSAGPPERKMGAGASRTSQILLDGARVPAARRIGAEGQGFEIALTALDSGRLGIAACAVGLAQVALDTAVGYAQERRQFGRPIGDFQGMQFLLADAATQVSACR
jgi:alkylation response protein AidB-like acyl-CoA dehydrogenase